MKKMKNENKASKIRVGKDRRKKGVSPVIGVILMVAATIVIAAVVLAMLGGFQAPSRQYIVTASATTNATGQRIDVTYNGGPDHALVDYVNVTVDGNNTGNSASPPVPGWSVSEITEAEKGAANDHVVVSAKFTDGSNQVILDTWV